MLTGNINWVAAPDDTNYWYLFIRFPKTNIVYEWKDLVSTNDLAGMSLLIEETILKDPGSFYDNEQANGDALYVEVKEWSIQDEASYSAIVIASLQSSIL
ncbi:MAG: hypothetical protein IPP79_05365 [Chitinophagaceae bacterium]|nr:hypothetical protein [Chitinophagaceae bacterium]